MQSFGLDVALGLQPQAATHPLEPDRKGSLNEYELDLLRQRSLEARRAMAKRGELIVNAPVGFSKTEDHRLERSRSRGRARPVCTGSPAQG